MCAGSNRGRNYNMLLFAMCAGSNRVGQGLRSLQARHQGQHALHICLAVLCSKHSIKGRMPCIPSLVAIIIISTDNNIFLQRIWKFAWVMLSALPGPISGSLAREDIYYYYYYVYIYIYIQILAKKSLSQLWLNLFYSTIKDGIYLLDVFHRLAVRPAMKVPAYSLALLLNSRPSGRGGCVCLSSARLLLASVL